jgi:subtilisin family serine protease
MRRSSLMPGQNALHHVTCMRLWHTWGFPTTLFLSTILTLAIPQRSASGQVHLGGLRQQAPRTLQQLLSPSMNASKAPRLIVKNSHLVEGAIRLPAGSDFSLVKPGEMSDLNRLFWAPPKHLLMDETLEWIDYEAFHERVAEILPEQMLAGTGAGVVVGIVDGGLDFTHPDFRNDDGSTRLAWFLDFTSVPQGIYPDLEQAYGCNDPDAPCGVFSAYEINAFLADGNTYGLADDALGHGTHVTSLAAGGGKANPKYKGVAPEATIIAARVSDSASEVQDGDVLLATDFIFARADELVMPAVVNLSLGGDFGPHDGSTALEQALSELIGESGRAIVVAAGNSGETLNQGSFLSAGDTLGIHAQVGVDDEASATILIPDEGRSYEAIVLAWVDTLPGEEVAVGINTASKTIIEPVPVGYASEGETRSWNALVSNGAVIEEEGFEDFQEGAFILLSGNFSAGEKIVITFEGKGSADIWVQSSGELGLAAGNVGALLRSARKGGTVSVPATSPDLISVGATLNRTSWPSRNEGEAQLAVFAESMDDTPGSVAFFSSLGPNQLGVLKPDILAPGMVVIGAMASTADPEPTSGDENLNSMFAYSPVCRRDAMCAAVSDDYGIAMGTSMAAPVVTGAVALLLQVDPTLTQAQILNLLRAGATKQPESSTTPSDEAALPAVPGLLNIAGSLSALEAQEGDGGKPTSKSWLSLADVFIRPDGELQGLFRARDKDGQLSDVAVKELSLEVMNADVEHGLTRVAPGLYEFVLRGDVDTQHKEVTVSVSFDDEVLAEAKLSHATDLQAVRQSRSGGSGGGGEDSCAIASGFRAPAKSAVHLAVALALVWVTRRRGKMTRVECKPLN